MKIQSKHVVGNDRVEVLEQQVTELQTELAEIKKLWGRTYTATLIIMVVVIAIASGMS